MAEIEESVIDAPPKRGRGRPKGSLNKKTIAAREADAEVREKLTLDVSFEEPPEEEAPEEEVPEEERQSEPAESAEPEEAGEQEPEPPPSPKKRAKRQAKPKAQKPVRMTEPEPPSYLEVLKRGLDIARHRQKAEKVERYDSFFRY